MAARDEAIIQLQSHDQFAETQRIHKKLLIILVFPLIGSKLFVPNSLICTSCQQEEGDCFAYDEGDKLPGFST